MTWREVLRVVVRRLVLGEAGPGNATDEPGNGTGETGEGDERSFRELEVVNAPATKTESLERTLDRAESVVDGQLTTLAEMQDKAVRTVRVEVVFLGAVASFSQLTSRSIASNVWLEASGVLLIASVVVGIFTSGSSSPDFGPGPNYVRANIDSGDPNEDVYLELLQGYSEAISYNNVVMNDSARYLFVTQTLLVASIVIGSVGFLLVN